jgi:NADH-quinone oxidoreductase subunit M
VIFGIDLLTCLLLIPLIGAFIVGVVPTKSARPVAILLSALMMALSFYIAYLFHPEIPGYQFEKIATWITHPLPLQYHVGVDGMSLSLIVLTTVVTFFSVLASYSIGENRPNLYYSFVMLLTLSLLAVFISLDLLQFFVAFEFELVPMYFLIAIWGGPRRDYAAMKFLIYTFTGGVLMLFSLLYLYFQLSVDNPMSATFNMVTLAQRCPQLPVGMQFLSCLGFFLAFIIKLPSFPFHTWLPDAHVEAPTPISMILAGLLLKMGSYGLIRVCLSFFPNFFLEHGQLIMALGAFNIVWAAMACLVQKDMKRIIAFSSVSHMGFVLLGIASLSAAGISGAIFQMISHGVISATLFFLVGTVYARTHTRLLPEIGGGLAREMPTIFYFWMFAALANLGLPGLSGFVAETSVFYGSITSWMAQASPHSHSIQLWIYFACTGVILTAGYMLWLLKRVFFGEELPKWVGHLSDATKLEKVIAYSFSIMILALGVYPLLLTHLYRPVADNLADALKNRISMNVDAAPKISVR